MSYIYSQSGKDSVCGGAVNVTLTPVALVQQRNVHGLRAVAVGCAVPCVPLQRVLRCQHVVVPKGSWTPPAGAICIPDKTIHHPHCSTQFKLLLQTACRQLWSALHVRVCNESPWNLPSGSGSQPQGLKGINEPILGADHMPDCQCWLLVVCGIV